jgi:hypothetical protein
MIKRASPMAANHENIEKDFRFFLPVSGAGRGVRDEKARSTEANAKKENSPVAYF